MDSISEEYGLVPCRPEDAIGQHAVRHRARERQQCPAPVAVGQQDAGQGEQPGRDQHTDEYHARGCLRSKPVAMVMMLCLYHRRMQE